MQFVPKSQFLNRLSVALCFASSCAFAEPVYFNISEPATSPELLIGLEESTSGETFETVTAILKTLINTANSGSEAEFLATLESVIAYPKGRDGLLTEANILQNFQSIKAVEPTALLSLPPYHHLLLRYELSDGRNVPYRADFICSKDCKFAQQAFSQEFENVFARYYQSREQGLLKPTNSDYTIIQAAKSDDQVHLSFPVAIDESAFRNPTVDADFKTAYTKYFDKVQRVMNADANNFESSLLSELDIKRYSKQDSFYVPTWSNATVEFKKTDFPQFAEHLLKLGKEPEVLASVQAAEITYYFFDSNPESKNQAGTPELFILAFNGSNKEFINPRKRDEYEFLRTSYVLEALAKILVKQ